MNPQNRFRASGVRRAWTPEGGRFSFGRVLRAIKRVLNGFNRVLFMRQVSWENPFLEVRHV